MKHATQSNARGYAIEVITVAITYNQTSTEDAKARNLEIAAVFSGDYCNSVWRLLQ